MGIRRPTDARRREHAGESGREFDVPLRRERVGFLGVGVGEPLWRVGDLPEGGGQGVCGNQYVEGARPAERRQRPLDRVGERGRGGGNRPPDLDDPLDVDLVFEMQVKVRQQVAKQRVGRQPVGQRLGHPRRRHRTRLAEFRAHLVRPAHPPFGGEMQQDLFVRGEIAAHRGIVNSGPTGDRGQGDRCDAGLECQRTRGFDQGRRALALVLFRASALEGELRHRQRITHVV
jgi:hypothetical protein